MSGSNEAGSADGSGEPTGFRELPPEYLAPQEQRPATLSGGDLPAPWQHPTSRPGTFQYGAAWQPTASWIGVTEAAAPGRPRRRWPLITGIAAAVLVTVAAAGGVAAYQVLNGGGRQPESVLPASSFAFAKIDLNPSAGQKIAAHRFLHSLPKLGPSISSTSGDLRQAAFQLIAKDAQLPATFDYAKDVQPWLGERAAVAAWSQGAPAEGTVKVVAAVQVTDQGRASSALHAMMAASGTDFGVAFDHGYALLAPSQADSDAARTAAEAASLSSSAGFRSDMALVGNEGVSAGWFDFTALKALLPARTAAAESIATSGSAAFALTFSSAAVQLTVTLRGVAAAAAPSGAPDITALPGDTVGAVSMSGLGRSLGGRLDHLRTLSPAAADTIDQVTGQLGLRLPADVENLLGSSTLVALGHGALSKGVPQLAGRSRTDPRAAAAALASMRAAFLSHGSAFDVYQQGTPDGIAIASSPAYLHSILTPSGSRLGDSQEFRQAVPDAAGSQDTAYLDLHAAADLLAQADPHDPTVAQFRQWGAFGLSVHADAGITTVRARLLAR